MTYRQFQDEDGQPYGSFETFHVPEGATLLEGKYGHNYEGGWYWWPCFPGCLPDGEPTGPFESEDEAVCDALDC